jgi:nicotinate-nucleotide pyrophosphorylase (carboxylating)
VSHPFALPKILLKQRLLPFLEQDLGFGDISSGIIPSDAIGTAKIRAKSDGILAGAEEAALLFEMAEVDVISGKSDGQVVKMGDIIFELNGKIRNILMIERTALNFLMKLSSIASSTSQMVNSLRKKGFSTIVATTRKVTPGLGWFEKKAVYLGGGDTHRWNLSDMVMLKDTHLKYFHGDLTKMIQTTKTKIGFTKKIEVEVEKSEDVEKVIFAGADIVMLDNMTPDLIQKTLQLLKTRIELKVLFEASGNITSKNVLEYAQTGVNIISTSALIFHPHIVMDFSLRLD